MATEVAPVEIDATKLVVVSKEQCPDVPSCGCKGGVPAWWVKSITHKS